MPSNMLESCRFCASSQQGPGAATADPGRSTMPRSGAFAESTGVGATAASASARADTAGGSATTTADADKLGKTTVGFGRSFAIAMAIAASDRAPTVASAAPTKILV